jgi:hypothetical protein
MALVKLQSLAFPEKAPAGWMCQTPKIFNPANHMCPTEGGAFILPSMVGASRPA